jgi:hypothetical protein
MIDLTSDLNIRNAFRFPLQGDLARREVLIGGLWLLVPFVGWLMNMGHRVMMVHRMQHGLPPWPSWESGPALLKHGCITWLGMVYYYSPAALLAWLGYSLDAPLLYVPAVVLFVLATLAIPGYMSHYCRAFAYQEIFNPFLALRRAIEGGRRYWRSWAIALSALLLSFAGLLLLGIGFFVTSVWFWQVAGYAFANTFTRTYGLQLKPDADRA